MTVIDYKNKVVASDTLRTKGCGRKLYGPKLFKATSPTGQKVVIAATGDLSKCTQLVKWYLDGCNPSSFPSYEKEMYTCLYVFKLASTLSVDDITYLTKLGLQDDTQCVIECYSDSPTAPCIDFVQKLQGWAAGCGADFALGAMCMIGTAQEGIEAAIDYNSYCGGNIQTINLEEL